MWSPWSWLCLLVSVVAVIRSALAVLRSRLRRSRSADSAGRRSVGFFHPFSTGGGGGERVLWTMLATLQRDCPADDFVLYTRWAAGGDPSHERIQQLIGQKFGLSLARPIHVVQLRGIWWVQDTTYPRLTLLLQSLGAIPLAWEALSARLPDVWIDSMGYAFSYPVAKYLGGCLVACYTHYPVVSSDMLQAISSRRESHNNPQWVARSAIITRTKILYYRLFGVLYGLAGRCADVVMVNSTWTQGHIANVWKIPTDAAKIVYPPCDCKALLALPAGRERSSIVSVAQFRPEKDHRMQIRAFALLRQRHPEASRNVVLHLVGGTRNEDDCRRVEELKALAESLAVDDAVRFCVNLPYEELKALLGKSHVGLHTMWNEHFGIGVVEYMAAGCIPVAHRSGGPLLDIVPAGCGYLADSDETFAEALCTALTLPQAECDEMRQRGREKAAGFSEEAFTASLRKSCSVLVATSID
eukprot:TRINITY_DN43024_c0_g1_i1.p1 TRINITY_DN43024_c0_g1~~TRINITY_DN43024_c0_g1_i1.p1  ORF type:complete len:487 (+),score=44.03 TRINITY_DN43024_c0_g1_i1:53-1462(+)